MISHYLDWALPKNFDMDEKTEVIQSLSQLVAIAVAEHIRWEEFELSLREKINDLIQNDFSKLVECLYRIDIDEAKLKSLLNRQANVDAAIIISQLIIERQLQKIRDRKKYGNTAGFSDEEKW